MQRITTATAGGSAGLRFAAGIPRGDQMKITPISPMISRPTQLMVDAVAAEFRQLTWPERSVGFALLWHDFQSSPAAWRLVVTVALEHLGVGEPDCVDAAAWMTVSHHGEWVATGDRWWREHPHATAAFEKRLPIYATIMPTVLDDLATRRAVALAQEAPPDLLGDFLMERRRFETPHKEGGF